MSLNKNTELWTGRQRKHRSIVTGANVPLSKAFRPALGPTQPPIYCVSKVYPWRRGAIPPLRIWLHGNSLLEYAKVEGIPRVSVGWFIAAALATFEWVGVVTRRWSVRVMNRGSVHCRSKRYICPPAQPHRPWEWPFTLFSEYRGLCLGGRRPWREADQSYASITEIKNGWSYTFVACTVTWHLWDG